MLWLVVDFIENGKIEAVKRQNGSNYIVVFMINVDVLLLFFLLFVVVKCVEMFVVVVLCVSELVCNLFKMESNCIMGVISSNMVMCLAVCVMVNIGDKIIIVIDVGYGGQDFGVIGFGGMWEKNVIIVIVCKLCILFNDDLMFKGVLICDGDYFILVMGCSDVVCK